MHMHRAVSKNRKDLRPLVDLKTLHKQEVKFKTEMLNDRQNVPQHVHRVPQKKTGDLLGPSI